MSMPAGVMRDLLLENAARALLMSAGQLEKAAEVAPLLLANGLSSDASEEDLEPRNNNSKSWFPRLFGAKRAAKSAANALLSASSLATTALSHAGEVLSVAGDAAQIAGPMGQVLRVPKLVQQAIRYFSSRAHAHRLQVLALFAEAAGCSESLRDAIGYAISQKVKKAKHNSGVNLVLPKEFAEKVWSRIAKWKSGTKSAERNEQAEALYHAMMFGQEPDRTWASLVVMELCGEAGVNEILRLSQEARVHRLVDALTENEGLAPRQEESDDEETVSETQPLLHTWKQREKAGKKAVGGLADKMKSH